MPGLSALLSDSLSCSDHPRSSQTGFQHDHILVLHHIPTDCQHGDFLSFSHSLEERGEVGRHLSSLLLRAERGDCVGSRGRRHCLGLSDLVCLAVHETKWEARVFAGRVLKQPVVSLRGSGRLSRSGVFSDLGAGDVPGVPLRRVDANGRGGI